MESEKKKQCADISISTANHARGLENVLFIVVRKRKWHKSEAGLKKNTAGSYKAYNNLGEGIGKILQHLLEQKHQRRFRVMHRSTF
mmetsp:Transcript_17636/g.24500  ORF Transcript_17636/g.24500 Transcript_17636/m.24500 type:complete len:86 (+) Transcript_17636:433-690(+)